MSDEEIEMGSARGSAAAEQPQDAGMADEISRILGKFSKYNKPQDPVMKKRKSKFLEAVESEKQEQKAMSLKVSQKKKQRTKDLHIPAFYLDQQERSLRKIATKGVVMLFNAISAHQKKLAADEEKAEQEREAAKQQRRQVNIKKMAEAQGNLSADGQKKNFMEALAEKREALSQNDNKERDNSKDSAAAKPAAKQAGWKVLKDDLLVGSSLKDWDKDNSDSDSDDSE